MLQLRLGNRELRASWGMALLALAGALLFTQLGRWQWHRAAEKRALAAAFASGSLSSAPLGNRSTSALPRYARVSVRGIYDSAHQFLLDNIIHDGRAGYEALTPLKLDDGRTLLVNRGWLPLPQGRRDTLPDLALAAAGQTDGKANTRVAVSGRLDALPVAALAAGNVPPANDGQWPKRCSFPTSAQLGVALHASVEPQQLLLDANQPQGFLRDWQPASAGFGPERHLAYAIQWWGLAALSLFLFFFLNLKRKPS